MKVATIVGTSIKKTDLAWLAGVIDSDGSIGFESGRKTGSNITVRVTVTNTDDVLISEVLRIYSILGISNYCKKRKKFGNDGHNRKPIYDLQVHRLREVRDILNLVIPFMHSKRRKAELAVEFCNIRISKREKVTRNADARYGVEEHSIVTLVNKLNLKGVQL